LGLRAVLRRRHGRDGKMSLRPNKKISGQEGGQLPPRTNGSARFLSQSLQPVDHWQNSSSSCMIAEKKQRPRTAMARSAKPVSRLHSKDPADAAWRAQQAHVDADIEGLARDPDADRLVAEMRAKGIEPRERIKLLINSFKARKDQKPAGP
jgi:hypothetical protein